MKTKRGTRNWRWSTKKYYRLGDLGFFNGRRVELIGGRLVLQGPQTPLHAYTMMTVMALLNPIESDEYQLRVKAPLDLGKWSQPEPDFAFSQGTWEQFCAAHPTSAALVIEVADASLNYDRRRKGSLYARAGIADYWLLNLVDNRLEVYRDPIPDASQLYGHRYASRLDLVPPANVSPLAFPGIVLPVASLLP